MFSARPEGGSRIINTATTDNAAEKIIFMPIRLFDEYRLVDIHIVIGCVDDPFETFRLDAAGI